MTNIRIIIGSASKRKIEIASKVINELFKDKIIDISGIALEDLLAEVMPKMEDRAKKTGSIGSGK